MKKILIVALLFTLLLGACARSQESVTVPQMPGLPSMEYDKAPLPTEAPAASDMTASAGNTIERLVIRNADLSISVADPAVSMAEVSKLADRVGGYVVSSNTWTNTSSSGATYTSSRIMIRVPSEKLEEVLAKVRALAVEGEKGVISESQTGEDVTSEYVDLDSQLKNLQAAEAQLQKLLDQATDLEYTLDIFRELTNIRGQIEVLMGRMKYLKEASALSAVSVEFVAEASLKPIEIGGWKPEGVAREALQALIDALQNVGSALIWFGIFCLPFLIPLGIGLYFLLKALKKRRAKKAAMAVAVEPIAPPAPGPTEKPEL